MRPLCSSKKETEAVYVGALMAADDLFPRVAGLILQASRYWAWCWTLPSYIMLQASCGGPSQPSSSPVC